MIDGLDLAYDDEQMEKGRHRRSAQRKRDKQRRGGRGKTLTALLLALVLLGTLAGGAWYGYDRIQGYFLTPDYDGGGSGEVVIEVKAGQSATEIANTLVSADVVKSAKAFVDAANANPKSRGIQVGSYKLRKQMRASDAVAMLLDPVNRWVNGVTIPEGMITLQIYAKLAEVTSIPVEEFKKAAADPIKIGVPDFWFKRDDGKKSAKTLEGFLFPATYELPPDATAEEILSLMVKKFIAVTDEMNFVETVKKERGISPYEALIAASIAEAESVDPKDFPKVARVLYNRVYTDLYTPCKCLQIDSAVNYWLRLQGKDPKDSDVLNQSELDDLKNPYNTHKVAGLPISPISNPGAAAIKGAMSPTKGDWIYFMTIDKKGTMGYGSNDADFKKLNRTMCANGVLTGQNC